jgi:hypothetical protein
VVADLTKRLVADGFDVVPVRVEDEGAVVIGVVVGAQARRAMVDAASAAA